MIGGPNTEAPERWSTEFPVKSQQRRDHCGSKRVYGYEGTGGSVMLNDGPVNKNEGPDHHKDAKNHKWFLFVAFVALSEPTDDREAFARCDWYNFVKCVGREGDQ